MTWADLVTNSLKRINILQAGETPSSDDLIDGFNLLKMMLGDWRIQRLTVPYQVRSTWTITSSKGILGNPYTVGPGGDIDIARPPMPNDITVRYQNTAVTPTLELRLTPLTDDAWANVPQKNLTSPLPTSYYYNPSYSGGFGSLYLWLVPTQSSLQGVIYAPGAIGDPASLSDTIVLPDGYDFAIQENLAMLMWPTWRENVSIDPGLVQSATERFRNLKANNLRMTDLSVDPALTARTYGRYSIYSDSAV